MRVDEGGLGLTIDLLNLGGQNPCRRGFVQAGQVSGETDRAWTLAEVFIPYGDAGYYPSLSALLNRRGKVRGFEFWVGAGGD